LKLLSPLLAAAVVSEQRSGAGRKLIVRDREALRAFIRQNFPNEETPTGLPSRVAGVYRFRDTKTFANDDPPIARVRAWHPDVLRRNGEAFGADLETKVHSVFSFEIAAAYTLHGPCALVENPAVFKYFERLALNIPLVIYGQGRASNYLIKWLANQSQSEFSLVHFPDYDPAGLNEFERLRTGLGSRVRLYMPDGLDQLFARYSNRQLLQKPKNQKLLSNLRRSDCPEVRRVIELIHRYNAGLEQEALLNK
jgi:hypothetical protein